uniref:C-type lectin domain-containing protein n=1 Tax=Knipowitschia caucasica TaxID=637954 RepID=A0AAV2MFX1_KNICA
MSWSHAQSHCREHYSDLASVSDMKDLEKLKSAARGHTDFWIGLHRTSNQRTWYWSQPTVKYNAAESVWVPGQPNNYDGGANNCVTLDTSGRLNDIPCDEKNSCFICFQGPIKKTLEKIKMSSFVDLNPLSPISEQLREHFKANNLGDVKLSWSKDVFTKERKKK